MAANPVLLKLVMSTFYGILTTDTRTTSVLVGGVPTPVTWYSGKRTLSQIQSFPGASFMLVNVKDQPISIPHARRADMVLRVAQYARSTLLPDGTYSLDADAVVFDMLDGLLQVLQDYPALGFEINPPNPPPPNGGLVVYHDDTSLLDSMEEADVYTSGAETRIDTYLNVRP